MSKLNQNMTVTNEQGKKLIIKNKEFQKLFRVAYCTPYIQFKVCQLENIILFMSGISMTNDLSM